MNDSEGGHAMQTKIAGFTMRHVVIGMSLALLLLSAVSIPLANPAWARQPVYNTAFLTDAQLEDYNSMNTEQIRAFLASYSSYFRQTIQDVDGQSFDPPAVIAQAASQYRINPKVILATLEKESNGVTRTTRPPDKIMRFLMGCVSSSTARQQIVCAAERFRAYHDQLTNNGSTVSGWRVGVPKTTQDGVTVTPATKAVAGQFTYTPYAGQKWGGQPVCGQNKDQPCGGVYLFYYAWNRFGFGGPTSCSVGQYRAEYYNNRSLSGSPTFTRCENAPINYDWGGGGPGNGVGNDNFSVRWTGRFNFGGGNYTFIARADDGIRVWVDGNLIIDAWRDQAPTEYRANRSLSAGEHEVKVEFYENGGGAVAQVRWEQASVTCPTGQYRAEYYNNRSLSGSPTFTRCEGSINYDWGGGGPGNGVGNDNFSVRWTGRHNFGGGNYTFIARADDGIRVWVDGSLIIDAWRDQPPTEYRANRSLSAGEHEVKVEYYENGGGAVAQVRWEQASVTCPVYRAEYYNNRYLSGNPTFVRCENWPINHDWGNGGPGNGVGNDNFSARWTGRAHINSGNYNFIARADDGIRVWVGGNLIIDAWRDQPPTEYRVSRYISNGDYDIKVEYYENGGGAVAQFRWEQAGSSGSYSRLVAKHSGRCMDVYGASRDNGAAIIQWDCHNGDNQAWSLVPVGNDYYKLIAKHSGKCLDVYGASRDNGARLIQWDCHGGDNQLFRKEQFGSYYRLRAKHSNRCVDVYGAQRDNGARLIQWDCHGGDNQLWSIQTRTTAVQDGGDDFDQPAMNENISPITGPYTTALIEHTVREGDSLELMASVYEVSVETILEANPQIREVGVVQPGIHLHIPVTIPDYEVMGPPSDAKRLYLPMVLR
jgi:hypothetical protein